MKTAYIDDEEIYFPLLRKVLNNNNWNDDIDTFSDTEVFLCSMKNNHYDLVFLDIEMPDNNGIFLSEQIRDINADTMIVYLTNHTETMFRAYGINVIGFIDKSRIDKQMPFVLRKAMDLFGQKKTVSMKSKDGQTIQLELSKILFCEIKNRKIFLYTSYGSKYILNYSTINDVYSLLDSDQMVYITRSAFINIKKIESIGKEELHLFGYSKPLFISRTRREQVNTMFLHSLHM